MWEGEQGFLQQGTVKKEQDVKSSTSGLGWKGKRVALRTEMRCNQKKVGASQQKTFVANSR